MFRCVMQWNRTKYIKKDSCRHDDGNKTRGSNLSNKRFTEQLKHKKHEKQLDRYLSRIKLLLMSIDILICQI